MRKLNKLAGMKIFKKTAQIIFDSQLISQKSLMFEKTIQIGCPRLLK